CFCNGIKLLCPICRCDRRQTLFFKHGQRWIHHTWAGSIDTRQALADGLDNFVSIAPLLRNQLQNHKAKFTVVEQPSTEIAAEALTMATPHFSHLCKEAVASSAEVLPVLRAAGAMLFVFIAFLPKHISPFLDFLRYI